MKANTVTITQAALVMLLSPSAIIAQSGSAEAKVWVTTTAQAQGATTTQGQGTATTQGQGTTTTQAQGTTTTQSQTPQARIDAALSAAAQAKIPVSLVQSKIAEGEAKRVPPERIAAAVETRVRSLVRASETLSRADIEARNEGELLVSADALDAGVSESALIRISREAPAERRTVAVAVLADLVRLGSASEAALTRVTSAVSTSSALANLHAEVSSQLLRSGLKSTLDATGIIRIP